MELSCAEIGVAVRQ